MPRRVIALMISGLAIVFAFGALTAIRWPSIVMFVSLFFHPDPSLGFDAINWRELGIVYGAPYFLAALCFYAAAVCLANRRKGAPVWYGLGVVAATPVYWLVDFQPGWWQNPNGVEGMLAGGSLIVAMLGYAVLLLRRPSRARQPESGAGEESTVTLSQEQFEQLMARRMTEAPEEPASEQPRRRRPVPAAIARQRAHFAAQGRRMQARRRR